MKKTIVLLILFVSVMVSSFSQDYPLVIPDQLKLVSLDPTSRKLVTLTNGMGTFRWDSTSTVTTNTNTVFKSSASVGRWVKLPLKVPGASKVLVSDANGDVTNATTTAVQAGYLSTATGVTGSQKVVLSASPTFTGLLTGASATFTALSADSGIFGSPATVDGYNILTTALLYSDAFSSAWDGSITLATRDAIYDAVSVRVQSVDTVVQMKALNTSLITKPILVAGYSAANDGGGGMFIWNASDTTATNYGTVFKGVTTGAELATGRWNRIYEPGLVNARWFGGVGDGRNDSAAVSAAVNALPIYGGIVDILYGDWAFNLVLLKSNVWLRGASGVHYNTGSMTNRWRPYTNAAPLIQIGNDTGYIRGTRISRASMDGQLTGAIGVYFAGGAFEARMDNCSVSFFTNCVKVLGGTTYPASLIYLDNVDGQAADVALARGLMIAQTSNYPTSYTTAVIISHNHWDGPAGNGYAVEVDSNDITISNSYFDMADGHGFKLSHTKTPVTKLRLSSVNLDAAGAATAVLIEAYDTNRIFSDVVIGTYSINGKWKLSDGTRLTPPPASWPEFTALSYPAVTGTLALVDGKSTNYNGGSYTDYRIYADTGVLWIQSLGTMKLLPGSGTVQIDGDSFGQSALKFSDNLHGTAPYFYNLDLALTLFLTTGGNFSIANHSGTSLFKVDEATGKLQFPVTFTAGGTTGNQTINKISGTVNIAAAGSSITVTDSVVTTASIVFAVIMTNDSTATVKNVVVSSGSFVITLTAAATAETKVGFFVVN